MNKHELALSIKKALYGKSESYRYGNQKLKFVTGSRPIKIKYEHSKNEVVRNDVLQIQLFQKEFKPSDVLWDIGGHYGHYSVFAGATVNGNNQIFCFEPDHIAAQTLKRNLDLNNLTEKVSLLECAVSDSDGEIMFDNQGGNSTSKILLSAADKKGVTIKSRSIASLLKELPSPTWVKLDIEGAEIHALRSAFELLANQKVRFICELHPFAWDSFGVKYQEFTDLLAVHGRTPIPLDPSKKKQDLPFYGTVLF